MFGDSPGEYLLLSQTIGKKIKGSRLGSSRGFNSFPGQPMRDAINDALSLLGMIKRDRPGL
jgi:hypothetical protein